MKDNLLKYFVCLIAVIVFSSQLQSQTDITDFPDFRELIREGRNTEVIGKICQTLIESSTSDLQSNSDPYAVWFSVKVAIKSPGETQTRLYDEMPTYYLKMIFRHKLEIPLKFMELGFQAHYHDSSPGTFIAHTGATPPPESGSTVTFNVEAYNYSYKDTHGKSFFIKAFCEIACETPDNGSISGRVAFHSENGSALWEEHPNGGRGMDGSPKAKLVYRRIGPGDQRTNSGNSEASGLPIPLTAEPGSFSSVDLTPGMYYPEISFRGCVHHYNSEGYFQKILTNSTTDWNHFTRSGNPYQYATAETVMDADFLSNFCLNNTLKGTIYRLDGRKEFQTKTVVLKPLFNTDDPNLQQLSTLSNMGRYEFTGIPTGTYEVYLSDNPTDKEKVKICNSPQLGEEPNITYTQDLQSKQTGHYFVMTTIITHEQEYDPMILGDLPPSPPKYKIVSKTGSKLIRIDNTIQSYQNESYPVTGITNFPITDRSTLNYFQENDFSINLKEQHWEAIETEEPDVSTYSGAKLIAPNVSDRLYNSGDQFTISRELPDEYEGYISGFQKLKRRNDNHTITWSSLKNLSASLTFTDEIILENEHPYASKNLSDDASSGANQIADMIPGTELAGMLKAVSNEGIKISTGPRFESIRRTITLRPATGYEIQQYMDEEYY